MLYRIKYLFRNPKESPISLMAVIAKPINWQFADADMNLAGIMGQIQKQ